MAKSNKIENEILKNIDLTENFLGKLLGQFFKPVVKRSLKKLIKDLDEDPEFKAALADLAKQRERTAQVKKDYCKKYPKSGLCR